MEKIFYSVRKEAKALMVDCLALCILGTESSIYSILYPIKFVAKDSGRENKEAASEELASVLLPSSRLSCCEDERSKEEVSFN